MTLPAMRLEPLGGQRRRGRGPRALLALLGLGLLAGAGVVLLRVGATPEVALDVGLPALGPSTPLEVRASAPTRGLSHVEVRLRQGEATVRLHEASFEPRPPWAFWGPMTDGFQKALVVDRTQLPAPRAETATLEVIARGAGTALFGAPTASVSETLEIRLRPPRLAVLSENVFVTQGGAEAVVYVTSERVVRHGVKVGSWFFPGYPLPGGGKGERFAFFGIPYDTSDVSEVELVAVDDVGNVGRASFIDQFTPKPFETDTIDVTDGFMEKVVPRILAKTPALDDSGTLLERYVRINSELRERNAETLIELAAETAPRILWHRPFVQMPAKVVSAFADRRTYYHEGKKIDRQDHLGFDLASVRKAAVPAANDGVVVFADYLGIYGNSIVIDHGVGLQSLYSHLSKIEVEEGERVERGETIGRTGATGLALGDHLHFTLLLHGLPVNPLEWWDSHWLHDRLALKLGDALGYEGE